MDVRGKIALVTGGSDGIGREIALAMARQGASVATSAAVSDALLALRRGGRGFGTRLRRQSGGAAFLGIARAGLRALRQIGGRGILPRFGQLVRHQQHLHAPVHRAVGALRRGE